MRSLYAIALLLTAGISHAQDPFQRIYPMATGSGFTYGGTVDAEGHYFMVQEHSEDDVVLHRIAPDGEHLWTKRYPLFTEEGFYGKSIAATEDGVMVVGYTMGLGTIARDAFIMKFDLDGNVLSQQRIDATSSNALHSLHKGSDGYFATGRTTGAQNYDMLLARIEEDGTMTWSKNYGVSTNPDHWDWARGATQLSDGGYVVVGFGDRIGTTATAGYVVRTDADGNELWSRAVSSGVSAEDINAVVEGSNGDIYVGGRSLGFISSDVSAFIVKLNSAGEYQWGRALQQGVEVAELHPGPDGGVTWLARPQYLPDGAGDYEVAWGQMGADGSTLRMKVFGASGSDWADNMAPIAGGGWAIFGSTSSLGTGGFHPFLLVIDAEGNSDCWAIDPEMEWVSVNAVVTPVTSTEDEGFQVFAMVTGTTEGVAGTVDPCCATVATFTTSGHTDPNTWTFTNTSTGATSYTWDFGDGSTSTEASPTHTYAANGAYTICLVASGECGNATSCTQLSISVGLADVHGRSMHMEVLPIPANETLTLRSAQRIGTVRMIDMGGRSVIVEHGASRTEIVLHTQQLPNGVYMVEAELGNGQQQRTRVVVAH